MTKRKPMTATLRVIVTQNAMQNTRQQILAFLETQQIASANEISRALHMTAANARHHLAMLVKQGSVEIIQQPTRGRGRPTQHYTLAHAAMQDNLDLLVDALLKVLLRNADAAQPFQPVIQALFGGIPASGHLLQRLNQTVQRFSAMKYRARWEASSSGPRVIFRHCPYASVLAENPELCQMDAAALAALLETPVEQLARLERDIKGATSCIFAVIPR